MATPVCTLPELLPEWGVVTGFAFLRGEVICFFGGHDNNNNLSAKIIEIPTNGTNIKVTDYGDLVSPRTCHTGIEFRENIFIFGGLGPKLDYLSLDVYSQNENKWEKGPDLSPRLGAAAVNVNGKMTITGGKPVKGRCADIVAYDCENGNVYTTTKMPFHKAGHSITLTPDQHCYIFGGMDENNRTSNELLELCLEQEKLFVCHPKNSISPRALHSASTTSSGCLLVCGGKNSASCVQDSAIYDPRSGLWTKITFDSNIDNKFGASMLTKNDEFYFLGGVDDKNVCDRKIYNFKL